MITSKVVVKSLQKALKLLEKRGGWCRIAYARTRSGRDVVESDPEAVRFCLTGALFRSATDLETRYWAQYMVRRLLDKHSNSISRFNDAQKRKAPVLAVLRRAIDKVKKEGLEV